MSVTIFGVLIALVGLVLLWRGSVTQMLAFVMIVTLMGGSAAINLPALGGSSIPPAHLGLLFLVLRVLLPGPEQMAALGPAVQANSFLLIFCLYGSISAFVLPFAFAHVVDVTPLKPGAVRQQYETAPVHFSSQNITTAVYMMGTLIAGLGTYIGASRPRAAHVLLPVTIAIAVTHALLGFASVLGAGTPMDTVLEWFRNGHYAQLDQSLQGVSRMNGIWPEASGYAAYGAGWFIFMSELWLRDVRPRATGGAALLLGLALLFSTSSTAYVALAGYGTMLVLRALLVPQSTPSTKLLVAMGLMLAGCAAVLLIAAVFPDMGAKFAHILEVVTVNKTSSYSGRQRYFWAMQGFDAFAASAGLGIGAGSFRSSSLVTAILGSMGIIGLTAFTAHMLRAFKPLTASTYYGVHGNVAAMGSAASWAALMLLVPAAVASASPDPSVLWSIFAGMALGLRRQSARRPTGTVPRTAPFRSIAGHTGGAASA